MSDIYAEIEREWLRHYKKIGCKIPSRQEFNDVCMESQATSLGEASRGLQPWLGILEFCIEWLSYVHIALDFKDGANDRGACHRVAWALTGAAVSFGLSLRSLCLSGFDTPARALLRSYVEALLLCLAALHDESLAKAYADAEDDADVKNFWHTVASPKNLHNRIVQIEKDSGLDSETVKIMMEYRQQEYEVLSQSAHLSYVASCLTAMAPALGKTDKLGVAIFGLATSNSLRTTQYAAMTAWYFSRFAFNPILGHDSSNCLLVVEYENDWHQRMVIGRDVLSHVTLGHWKK